MLGKGREEMIQFMWLNIRLTPPVLAWHKKFSPEPPASRPQRRSLSGQRRVLNFLIRDLISHVPNRDLRQSL